MRVHPVILSELRGIIELSDVSAIRSRLEALMAACTEPSPAATRSVGPVILVDSSAVRDAIEQSDAASLSRILALTPSVSNFIVDAGTGVTALHRAVEIGDVSVVNLLLEQIDSEAHNARSLHNLAGELLMADLKRKINPQTAITGYTPLHFAVSGCHDEVIAELLRRGADADCVSLDDQRVSPFLLACELGQETAVQMMIKVTRGTCADRTDAQGNTGLHLAAENGHSGIAEILMQIMPALARYENVEEKTPVSLARELGFAKIADLIDRMDQQANVEQEPGLFFA